MVEDLYNSDTEMLQEDNRVETLSNASLEDCYQLVAESMFENIHEPWKEAWIDAEVMDDWGQYTGDYRAMDGTQKWYAPEFQRKDLGLLEVFLRIRVLMKHPDQEPWNRIRFWMSAEGDFKIDVKYPGETTTTS